MVYNMENCNNIFLHSKSVMNPIVFEMLLILDTDHFSESFQDNSFC